MLEGKYSGGVYRRGTPPASRPTKAGLRLRSVLLASRAALALQNVGIVSGAASHDRPRWATAALVSPPPSRASRLSAAPFPPQPLRSCEEIEIGIEIGIGIGIEIVPG